MPGAAMDNPFWTSQAAWLITLGLAVATWWLAYRLFARFGGEEEGVPLEAADSDDDAAEERIPPVAPGSMAIQVVAEPIVGKLIMAEPIADEPIADEPIADEPILLPRSVSEEPPEPPEISPDPPNELEPALDFDLILEEDSRLEKLEAKLRSFDEVDPEVDAFAVRALRDTLGVSGAAIWTQSSDTQPGSSGESGIGSGTAFQLDCLPPGDDEPLASRFSPWRSALDATEPVFVPDVSAEPDLIGKLRSGIASIAIVPFPTTLAIRGVVVLAWDQPLVLGPRRSLFARRATRVVGRWLEGLRSGQELASLRAQTRILVEAGSALSRAPDLSSALDGLLHMVRDRLGHSACAILLVDESGKALYVSNTTGYKDSVRRLRLPADGPSVTATAARENRIINVPDVSRWDGYVEGSAETRSEIALPLAIDGKAVGVLDVESHREAAFGGRDRVTLEAVASQAAIALAHFRILAQLDERATQLQLVDDMARAISSTLDAESLFQIVVDQVRATVGCERATLVEIEAQAGTARVVALSSAQPVDGLEVGTAVPLEGIPSEQLEGTSAFYAPDLESQATPVHSKLLSSGFRSLVRVPIHIDGKIAGLFTASSLRPSAFTPTQIATLEAVAPHVSAALRNARLFQQLERSYQQLNEAQGQLVQSEQLRVLGEMASGVAHNFNNVLGAILGRAQLVRQRVGDPTLARELAVIEQAATDGAATVRRLQEFTRVRSDREFNPVDLSQVARDALALTRTWWKDRAEERGTSYGIVTDLVEGAWVEGQDHELREVVINIVLNALEAMPNGGSMTLRTRAADGQATLSIVDTGVGMSEEVRSRIFHPFYSTKGPRGTGLGLSIAYGILQRHGGTLDVESRRGAGTTIRVSIPLSARTAVPAAPEPLYSAVFEANVLVVEDEPTILSLLVDMIEGAGYRVCVARTGREAVEQLIEGTFHVVLTDLGMPEMSGWELARHCRDLYPDLPVVLVTGWGVELDEGLVHETGVRAVVSKPFSVAEILQTLANVLEDDPDHKSQAA